MHRHTTIIRLLSLVVVLALVACSKAASTPTKPQPTATVEPNAAEQPSPTVPTTATPLATVQPAATASPTVRSTAVPPATPTAPLPTPTASVPVIGPSTAAQLTPTGLILVANPSRLVWTLSGQMLGVQHDSSVDWFDAGTLQRSASLNVIAPASLLDASADGHTAAVQVGEDQIELRDVITGQTLRSIKPSTRPMSALFAPDGKTLAVTLEDIVVELWDVASGNLLRTLSGFQTAAPVYSVRWSTDGRTLIWISRATVQLMDVATGQLGMRFSHEEFVMGLALSPDGKTLAVITAGAVNKDYLPLVKLWDTTSGHELGNLIDTDSPSGLAFSPDGRLLAVGWGKNVTLWDVASRQKAATLSGHSDVVREVAFAPDGSTLASASSDGTVRLWRLGS